MIPGIASAQQIAPVDAGQIESVLAQQLGPILDVRLDAECDETRRLRRTATKIAFDALTSDKSAAELGEKMFLERVSKNGVLSKAKRSRATILVVCCGGVRSAAAATFLAAHGYKVHHLKNGLTDPAIPEQVLVRK
jgi:rhodanese-related sulfurtransferase